MADPKPLPPEESAASEMQQRRGLVYRFEIRVPPEMYGKVDRIIAVNDLTPYTCIAEQCEACNEDVDECSCDEDGV